MLLLVYVIVLHTVTSEMHQTLEYNSFKVASVVILKHKIKHYQENSWLSFVSDRQNLQIARSCLANVSPEKFWAITAEYPDLVCWPSCFGSE